MERNKTRPGNYLSLDGGDNWLSALPALITLEEIMKRFQRDLNQPEAPLPCKVFDVITASGHAALAALMVGKMGLTPSQATESYKKLEPALSVGPTEDKNEQEKNMEAFKKAFIEVLEEHGFKEETLMVSKEQNESEARIIICTQTTLNHLSLYPIRSYPVRGARVAPCTILQAACASIATPDRFPSVTIGSGYKKMTLINAVPNYANPTKVLLHEAHRIFGNEGNVAAIVSIGSGRGLVPDGIESSRDNLVGDTMGDITSKCEQVHEHVLTLLQKLFVYFRFNYDQISGEIADSSSIDSRLSTYFQQDETSKNLDDAVESMTARQKGGNLLDINVVDKNEVKLKPRPSVVPNFVGRQDIIEDMRHKHFGERSTKTRIPAITVLSGLGGSGKTQIALKFADEFEERCPNVPVYFLNAGSEQHLKADFETIIRAQGAIYRSQSCDDALAWLAAKERKWCLILDNADDPSFNIFPYIPKSAHGNVIITTRNSTNALFAPDDHHTVDGLPMEDAVTLILQMAHYESTAENQLLAHAILKELGSLPLALAHAGGYIFVHQCLTTYLEMYRESRTQFLESNQALPQDYQLSVATTVQMSLEKLPRVTKDMMVVFSHLEASLIPLQIISKSAERRFSTLSDQDKDEITDPQTIEQAKILMTIFCPEGEWFELDFNASIQKCLEYSLLQIITRDDDRFFSMHVLVQAYLQSTSTTIQEQRPEQLVVRLLGSSITVAPHHKYQAFDRLLALHLRLVVLDDIVEAGDHYGYGYVLHEQGNARLAIEHSKRCLALRRSGLGDENIGIMKAMNQLALCYNAAGQPQEALELQVKVLDLAKRVSGEEHPDAVFAMGNLAVSYNQLGRYQEALELQMKVLDLWKRVSGDEHPNTLMAMNSLALFYRHLGSHREALELQMEALDVRKRVSGNEHPDTLMAMNNLALSYNDLGNYQEGLKLQMKVLDLRKRVSGDEHPDTLMAMGNLAVFYNRLGRYQEALELQMEALDVRKRVSGNEHPDTLMEMNNLALSYSDLGNYQEALKLQVKVLDLRKRVSGDEHPDTLMSMGNLATFYNSLGRYQEALELQVKVLDLRKRISGNEHPETLRAMANLAAFYKRLRKYQEALEIEESVLDLRKRVSGDEHPDTLLTMGNIAASYNYLERYQEALELQVKVLDLRKRVSGDENPGTLMAMGNLAMCYSRLGRYREALELQVKVLDMRKRVSGDEHPDTLLTMGNLAGFYNHLGRHQEALELRVKVVDLLKRVLGDEHPDTLMEMNNLALSYSDLGNYQEALKLQMKVLDLRKRVSGEEHPDTLLVMANLAAFYKRLGKYQEALEIEKNVLDLRRRVSGDEHPDALLAMVNLATSYKQLGMYQEGLELQMKVLNLEKRVSGDEHPDTLLAMGNLAAFYNYLGKYQEGLELQVKVLDLRKRISGDEHPETLLAMANLAVIYSRLGKYQEGLEIEEKVLEMRKKHLGEEHPDTLLSMCNLAATASDLGRKERAIALLQVALPLREKVLGIDHPSTISTKRALEFVSKAP